MKCLYMLAFAEERPEKCLLRIKSVKNIRVEKFEKTSGKKP